MPKREGTPVFAVVFFFASLFSHHCLHACICLLSLSLSLSSTSLLLLDISFDFVFSVVDVAFIFISLTYLCAPARKLSCA